jgi:bifunctional UDP-N-acetylglucosamine pyrophosphorylase/glucosamine-1-phosphate N-acetyltransferase
VLVLCGDVPLITPATLGRLLAAAAGSKLAVLTADVADPNGYGRIVRDAAGRIERIAEQKDATPEELSIGEINTGIIAADAATLRRWLVAVDNDNAQGEYYLTDIIGLAAREGTTVASAALADVDEAMGINDKMQLARAERYFQRRSADALLAAGVTLADPARLDVRGRLECGTDVFIDVGVVLEGNVSLGDGCRVGPYAVLRNVSIGSGTTIHPHSVIDDSTIGAGCEIGPFARLRPATALGDRVKIGNFVETKKSRVASGSKASHLSYIGDTTVGANVNIGAGTIVCNYDGANKHPTTIGDGVFVGSGTELVAPVNIGSGATIGAGSTITKDVPEHTLTLARSRQTTIEGWKRPVKKRD